VVHGRRTFDPADAVVWTTAALLALLSGIGAGFVLWSVLSNVDAPPTLRVLVYAGALLVGGILPLRQSLRLRLFLALAAAALIVSFSLGATLWAPLVGS